MSTLSKEASWEYNSVLIQYYPCSLFSRGAGIYQATMFDILMLGGRPEAAVVVSHVIDMTEEHAKRALELQGYASWWFAGVTTEGIEIKPPNQKYGKDIVTWTGLNYQAYRYLIGLGYALPLWFSDEHELNGRNVIELGWGIENKTALKWTNSLKNE